MRRYVLAGLLLAFLSIRFQAERSDGRKVEILLRDNVQLYGEILAVRDSSMS